MHFKFYIVVTKKVTYTQKSRQKLCVIHSRGFEIIACTTGAKVVQIFAPVCTGMCKMVRVDNFCKTSPFLLILFLFSSAEESSSCSRKVQSNLVGKTDCPSQEKAVYRVFSHIHHSALAWAIGIPSLFS